MCKQGFSNRRANNKVHIPTLVSDTNINVAHDVIKSRLRIAMSPS